MLEQKNNFQHPRSVIPTQTSHKEKITNIRGIQSDSKGNIWAGYRNGLILIKKTKLDKFEIKIYNKFNLKNSQININNLYFEKGTHHLWACTRDFGLFMFELDEQSNITNQTRFYLSESFHQRSRCCSIPHLYQSIFYWNCFGLLPIHGYCLSVRYDYPISKIVFD